MATKHGLPEFGELVICRVKRISQFAAWCDLEEYKNLEGMIHISEVAGKWVHDIKKFVKLEKQYVAKVIRVDEATKTLNLSLKRVSDSEERRKWDEFRKEQRAEGILKVAAKELEISLEHAYEKIGFPLRERFADLYTALVEIKKSPETLIDLKIPEKWQKVLVETIGKSIVEKEFELKAELQLISYENDGIERIKEVLKNLEKSGVDVSYITAPKYRLEIKTKNPKADSKKFEQQIQKAVEQANKLKIEASYNIIG